MIYTWYIYIHIYVYTYTYIYIYIYILCTCTFHIDCQLLMLMWQKGSWRKLYNLKAPTAIHHVEMQRGLMLCGWSVERTAIMRPHWLISVALWMALWWVGWSTAVSAAYRPSFELLYASKTLSISCMRAGPLYQNDACKSWAGRVAGGLRVAYSGAMFRHWHVCSVFC